MEPQRMIPKHVNMIARAAFPRAADETVPLPPIFRLPRELRDLIYDYYIRCDGGYVFDAETQRLVQPNGEPVCHALALTCKQAASELEGLAFQLNPITFSATHSTSTHEKASLHHRVVLMLRSSKQALLEQIIPRLFTQRMAQTAAKRYPQFAGLINFWMAQRDVKILQNYKACKGSFGEAMSIWDDFVRHVLELISEHPVYAETVEALPSGVAGVERGRDPLRLKDTHLQPWLIVDLPELKHLSDVILSDSETQHRYTNTCYAYSAAAVALRFLASCTKTIRASVRRIILEENHVSVAQPECHGRGFIPVCRENTKLRVERRVSLWKTVFPVRPRRRQEYITAAEHNVDSSNYQNNRLRADDVTQSIGKWVTETMVLQSLGMPEGSYMLILDGDPISEHTSNVFRIVQRDATWQAAFDTCLSRGLSPENPFWLCRRRHNAFIFEGLPGMIRTLSTSSAPIRCNFQLSSPYDVDRRVQELLEKGSGWRWQDWECQWSKHNPREFQTEAPLPPWHLLRWRHVLP